jgi:predicted nuclease of predicted toxin-antitoxin system
MKFKIDENLPVELAEILNLAEHDARTVFEENLQGKEDQDILDACIKEGRILISLDKDFADIRTYPPHKYPGLIILRVGNQSKARLLKLFRKVIPLLHQEPIKKRLVIVEETKIRIWGKNI